MTIGRITPLSRYRHVAPWIVAHDEHQGMMFILLRFALLPVVAAAGGDELYNNLFTDLTPIVALFGEQVSKQFLAQSTTFTECLLFALAPLGILTGVVSAIRVGGYPWLKAVVGRAAESRAAAGLELTSATSSSIWELWDGRSVVRVHGSPKILTIVYLEQPKTIGGETSQDSEWTPLRNPVSSAGSATDRLSSLETAKSLEWLTQDSRARSRQGNRVLQAQRTRAVEWEQVEYTLPQEQVTSMRPRKPIPPIPPNIALNAKPPVPTSILALVTGLAFSLQAAVLVFGGWVNYVILPFESRASAYAFPLMMFGTLLVEMGMAMCAWVVISSSRQERWYLTSQVPDSRLPRVIWLQRKQTVNDETFLPYGLSSMRVCPLH